MKIDVRDERFHVVRDEDDPSRRARVMWAAEQILEDRTFVDELRHQVRNGGEFFEDHDELGWADEIIGAVDSCEFDMSEGCKCAVGTVLGAWGRFDELRAEEGISAWECGFLAGSRMAQRVKDEKAWVENYNEADAAIYTALEVLWYEAAEAKIDELS